MKSLLRISLLVLLSLPLIASADSTEEKIKKLLQHRLGESSQIEAVSKTPYNGLYEVRVGNEIIYSDAEAKYVFIGRILDTETSKDLTQARMDEINRISSQTLKANQDTYDRIVHSLQGWHPGE